MIESFISVDFISSRPSEFGKSVSVTQESEEIVYSNTLLDWGAEPFWEPPNKRILPLFNLTQVLLLKPEALGILAFEDHKLIAGSYS